MDQATFQRQAVPWKVGDRKDEARTRGLRVHWVVLAAAVVIGLVWLGGYQYGKSPVAGMSQRTARLQRQLHTASQTRNLEVAGLEHQMQVLEQHRAHCYTDDSDIENIQRLETQADYKVAAALADLDLSNVNKPLCPETQAGLALVWYQSSINGLLATPPTTPMDQTPVLAWEGIERRAEALGLSSADQVSPMTVFTMSYNNHLWLLARASFLAAWNDNLVGPGDVTQIQTYYADLTNLGLALTRQTQPRVKDRGFSMLSTAAAIGKAYEVGGEAESDLQSLLDRRPWPHPDSSDPILAAAKTSR